MIDARGTSTSIMPNSGEKTRRAEPVTRRPPKAASSRSLRHPSTGPEYAGSVVVRDSGDSPPRVLTGLAATGYFGGFGGCLRTSPSVGAGRMLPSRVINAGMG